MSFVALNRDDKTHTTAITLELGQPKALFDGFFLFLGQNHHHRACKQPLLQIEEKRILAGSAMNVRTIHIRDDCSKAFLKLKTTTKRTARKVCRANVLNY